MLVQFTFVPCFWKPDFKLIHLTSIYPTLYVLDISLSIDVASAMRRKANS